MRRRISMYLTAWIPVAAWMTVIYLMSTRQRITVSQTYVVNFLFFKTLHVLEYAALFLLCVRAMILSIPIGITSAGTYAFLLTMIYAVSDELHQLFVPTREGSLRDGIIDALGALLAWLILRYIIPRAPKKLRRWVNGWVGLS